MVARTDDWLRQALRDLSHAEKSLRLGDYEWACFASHQAAEKAVKALYQELGVEVWVIQFHVCLKAYLTTISLPPI